MIICENMKNKIVYSLGHSNVDIKEFLNTLKKFHIQHILDIRSVPKSAYVPHFDKENLEDELTENKIGYTYCGLTVGGRQKIDFLEYSKSSQYHEALKQMERIIDRKNCAIMCSEKDFRHCHRRFVSDSLIRDGYEVIQIEVNKDLSIKKTQQISFISATDYK
jgi:uncharacterized protein (DUF488 family)